LLIREVEEENLTAPPIAKRDGRTQTQKQPNKLPAGINLKIDQPNQRAGTAGAAPALVSPSLVWKAD
jgi:hypothetical protein